MKLAGIVVSGVSSLVRVTANLAEHDVVPFLSTLGVIIGCIVKQAEAVGTNHTHVAEAGKRASAVQKDVETLSEAEFPADHPTFVNILNELAQLNEYAEKWNEKGYWSQRFGISKTGTTKALRYQQKFEEKFKRLETYLHMLTQEADAKSWSSLKHVQPKEGRN